MTKTRLGRLAAAGLAVAATAAVAAPGSAQAAPASCQLTDGNSIDEDHFADVVVGLPGRAAGAGAVDVRLSGHPTQVLTRATLGAGTPTPGDRFGASVVLGDFDGNGCMDALVGAPGEDGHGAVHLVFGSQNGLVDAGTVTLPGAAPGDEFGAAVAGSRPTYGIPRHDVWVGAPGRTVAGKAQAGAVYRFVVTRAGDGSVNVSAPEEFRQGAGGVPGAPEAGDRFGEVLSAGYFGVAVGEPGEDVGTKTDAGMVTMLRIDPVTGQPGKHAAWTQDSPGVPDTAEAGDHFGAAVAAWRADRLVVGVPGEDLGTRKDAGAVQVFGSETKPDALVTQDSAGIPGTAEAGDRFGAAVSVGVGVIGTESQDVAVGVPGEDVGSVKDAGAVTLFPLWKTGRVPKGLTQGAGLAGTAEAGDRVGQTLARLPDRDGLDDATQDRMLVGVPGEDLGTVADAGIVELDKGKFVVNNAAVSSTTFSGGATAGLGYGAVLASWVE